MIQKRTQLSVIVVAALAIATIAIVLAVTSTAGPAWAQRGGPTSAPQLCGPGQDNFPANPDEVVSSGHYALFDGYWEAVPGLGDEPTTGTLNDNLCPPAATHTDVSTGRGQTKEVTTRSPSKIDVRTTIIQVKDTHQVDVVATNAEAGTTKLSLEKYKEVRAGLGLEKNDPVPAGTKVYWLRLEDGSLPPSDLVLGFSTGLLDGNYWDNPGSGPTFEYELESVRVLGAKPSDLPHVLTYWEPELRKDGKSVVVWDGVNTDVNSMPMEAGEYEHLEWVFTKPGTYVLQVHLKGHVRQSKPEGWKTEINGPWKALTADKTVTSEVKRFVFQVGDLHINDQPHFGVSRTVKAGSAANTNVGDPIPLYGVDGDELHFTLEGSGHEDFKIVEVAGVLASITAQLAVAEKADLRYAERPYYDLRLRVSDRHDHENNKDTEQDDVIAVRIQVLPSSGPWVSLVFNDQHPQAKNEVVVDMVVAGMPAGATVSSLTLYDGVGDQKTQVARSTGNSETARFTVTQDQGGTRNFSGVVEYQLNNQSKTISSAVYPITWRH